MEAGVAPLASARSDASWIVGPSITGSENGMPISIASAPASASARTTSIQPGRPPVAYGTSNFRPASRAPRSDDSSQPRVRGATGGTGGGTVSVIVALRELHHLGDVLVAT